MTTFLYFGYGSNLLTKRLHLSCPSAVRQNIAKLKDHKIAFFGFSKLWQGGIATIVKSEGSVVWGSVWKINEDEKIFLDEQEGVNIGLYTVNEILVKSIDDQEIVCRTYQKTSFEVTLPSLVYKNVIIKGAVESNLPETYVTILKSLADNGHSEPVDINL